jgi:hypothetical protein
MTDDRDSLVTPPPPSVEDKDPSRAYRGPQNRMDWDDRHYWVSQLFEEQWRPHPTYQRESIPF